MKNTNNRLGLGSIVTTIDNACEMDDYQTDTTLSDGKPSKTRTLSEDFYSRSPNTQMYVRFYTGGKSPSSKIKKVVSCNNLENYRNVSKEVRDILVHYGIIAGSNS